MKALVPLAILALAALSPAPINDLAHAPAPVAERSQAALAKEMTYAGAYQPVGQIPRKIQEGTPLRDRTGGGDKGSVVEASNALLNDSGDTIVRATAHLEHADEGWHMPTWLLMSLAVGGAFGIVRGFKVWADRNLPSLNR